MKKNPNWGPVDEWDFDLVARGGIAREPVTLITVYNNVGVGNLRSSSEKLTHEIERRGDKILIVGDWNARIGKEQRRTDKHEDDEWHRNSEDKTLNWEGRRLLDICGEMGWTILNGRSKGDEEGKFTYVGPKASSVLDYITVQEDGGVNLTDHIEVVARTESDHLPIRVQWIDSESGGDKMKEEKGEQSETIYMEGR